MDRIYVIKEFFFSAPEHIVLYTSAGRGVVGMYDANNQEEFVDQYIIGRSPRPVAVAYDPIEQVSAK